MVNPYIIGISGESGVGKSTIAEIITLFFGVSNTVILSTDDLHKWERTNKNWETFTHLNPDANNLELGDIHLQEMLLGKSIYRSIYNHDTGYFDSPLKIDSKPTIVIEGLHAFYTDFSKETIDLKIFIDTDEKLRTHWKIIRDTEERGYKYNVVLDTINKRKTDNDKIREAQIGISDVIINISTKKEIVYLGDKNEKINLDISISFTKEVVHKELFEFIQEYFIKLDEFISHSEILGNNIEMCQDGGGNISIKLSDQYMMIKSSGYNMKNIHKFNGYSIIDYQKVKNQNDHIFNTSIVQSVISNKYKRPSMETGFHIILNEYVIHIHPIYLTCLLCLSNSKEIISELYGDLIYQYIEYVNPGFDLFNAIYAREKCNIFFLENHGVIVSADSMETAHNTLEVICAKAKEYVKEQGEFQKFDCSFESNQPSEEYLFPDSAIFLEEPSKKEIRAAHNYINMLGSKIGNLRHLTYDNVHLLKGLESEQYRKIL